MIKTQKPEIGKWYAMTHSSDNRIQSKIWSLKYLHSMVKLGDDGLIYYYFRPSKIFNAFQREVIILTQEDINLEAYILWETNLND